MAVLCAFTMSKCLVFFGVTCQRLHQAHANEEIGPRYRRYHRSCENLSGIDPFMVREAIGRGADANARNRFGDTPLSYASRTTRVRTLASVRS